MTVPESDVLEGEILLDEKTGSQSPTWLRSDETDDTQYRVSRDVIIKFLKKCGIVLHPWQLNTLMASLAVNDSGKKWLHDFLGVTVGRQNGKTLIAIARCLVGLVLLRENIIYSANNNSLALEFFREMMEIIRNSTYLQKHLPIRLARNNGPSGRLIETSRSKAGFSSTLYCMTRGFSNADPGRGKRMINLVIYDEAQFVSEAHAAALSPTKAQANWQQSLLLATPPKSDEEAEGWFLGQRESIRSGHISNGIYWAEWSISEIVPREDSQYWFRLNPSLNLKTPSGNGLTYQSLLNSAKELGSDKTFSIERLGYMPTRNTSSLISYGTWASLRNTGWQREVTDTEKVAFAVKINFTGTLVTVCAASADVDRDTFVDIAMVLEDPAKRRGNWADEVAGLLEGPLRKNKKLVGVILDGPENHVNLLKQSLAVRNLWDLNAVRGQNAYRQGKIEVCNPGTLGNASVGLVSAISRREVVHRDPDTGFLSNAVKTATERQIKGKPDLHAFDSLDSTVDSSPLEAAALAFMKANSSALEEYGKSLLESNKKAIRVRWNTGGDSQAW